MRCFSTSAMKSAGVSRARADSQMGIGREKIFGLTVEVGEITAASAGNEDFFFRGGRRVRESRRGVPACRLGAASDLPRRRRESLRRSDGSRWPQRLKPDGFGDANGTTEAVPFPFLIVNISGFRLRHRHTGRLDSSNTFKMQITCKTDSGAGDDIFPAGACEHIACVAGRSGR